MSRFVTSAIVILGLAAIVICHLNQWAARRTAPTPSVTHPEPSPTNVSAVNGGRDDLLAFLVSSQDGCGPPHPADLVATALVNTPPPAVPEPVIDVSRLLLLHAVALYLSWRVAEYLKTNQGRGRGKSQGRGGSGRGLDRGGHAAAPTVDPIDHSMQNGSVGHPGRAYCYWVGRRVDECPSGWRSSVETHRVGGSPLRCPHRDEASPNYNTRRHEWAVELLTLHRTSTTIHYRREGSKVRDCFRHL